MSPSPAQTYAGLYAHVARLSAKAIAQKPLYLLAAPVVALLLGFIHALISMIAGVLSAAIGGMSAGLIAGLAYFVIKAAGLSLILFIGRAIIEQRRLRLEDFQTGLGAFLSDMMTVLFVFGIVALVTNGVLPFSAFYLELFAGLLFPLFETAALAPVGGYAIFESAFRFFQRDALPWLFGQLPLLPLVAGIYFLPSVYGPWGTIVDSVFWMVVLMGFVYRGVLFLTLDNYSPRRRAERFGGAPGLR